MTALLKQRLIAAHRSKDWELAAMLSQEHQQEKHEARKYCRVCGLRTTGNGLCQTHYIQHRFHGDKLTMRGTGMAYEH